MSPIAAAAPIAVALAGCGGGDVSSAGNERRLTLAESTRIVDWATGFRACVVRRGLDLPPLTVGETRIEMRIAPTLEGPDVVRHTTPCAEARGGPPKGVTLQYRPGRILLYVPKQCLLDESVLT